MASARAENSTPAPRRIAIDLDAEVKDDEIEPMIALIGGREIEFNDVRDLPWDELGAVEGDPDEFVFRTLSDEDYEYLKKQRVPGWRLDRLIQAYRAHFKLDRRGRAGSARR